MPIPQILSRFLPAVGKTGAKAAAAATPQATRFAGGALRNLGVGIAGTALGTAGLGLAAGIPGYRDQLIQGMVSEPPGSDGYDRGFLGYKNLFMLPSDSELDAERTKNLKDLYAEELNLMKRGGLGDDAYVDPNETNRQNRARLQSFQTQALAGIQADLEKQKFMGPVQQMLRYNQQL